MKIDCQTCGRCAAAMHDAYMAAMASAEFWAARGDLQLADSCVEIANRHELRAVDWTDTLIEHLDAML